MCYEIHIFDNFGDLRSYLGRNNLPILVALSPTSETYRSACGNVTARRYAPNHIELEIR